MKFHGGGVQKISKVPIHKITVPSSLFGRSNEYQQNVLSISSYSWTYEFILHVRPMVGNQEAKKLILHEIQSIALM